MTSRPAWVRSVRTRLTAWYAVVLTLMLVLLGVGVHLLVRTSLRAELKTEFEQSLSALERVVLDSPQHLDWFDAHSTVDFFVVRQSDGDTVYQSEDWKNEAIDPEGFPFRGLSQWPWVTPPDRFFRFQSRTVETPAGNIEITVAQDVAPYERTLRELMINMLLATPIALILVTLGGYFMAGRVLEPVGAMATKAAHITAENLSERLPVDNPDDEFGRLAMVFNNTLSSLEDSFERLRRFTADASHELRTPLTALRTVGEVGLAEPFNPEACREAVASMLEEADRLARLIDGLLTLTRGDAGVVDLKPERLNLMETAGDVVDLLRVLAEEKEQQITISGDPDLVVRADRGTIRQVLVNLLDNAVCHTPMGGEVQVIVGSRRNGVPYVEVRDEGPGIAPEHRKRIFDRFYRVDSDRSGSSTGLGLAIAQWAARANKAEIKVESRVGAGSVFRVLFRGEVPRR